MGREGMLGSLLLLLKSSVDLWGGRGRGDQSSSVKRETLGSYDLSMSLLSLLPMLRLWLVKRGGYGWCSRLVLLRGLS
jgi:hypothetical protein